jgi:hypothetical protein
MAFFSFGRETAAGYGTPAAVDWVRSPKGRFYSLISFNSEVDWLKGVSGVFVIWHAGVKPTWVYVGRSGDLAATLRLMAQDEEILFYHKFGGLMVSWAPIKEEFQAGVLKYLTQAMTPLIENPDHPGDEVAPIAVTVPGAKGRA